MRALVPAVALLLLLAGSVPATGAGTATRTGTETSVRDGFTWDSGPGRHNPRPLAALATPAAAREAPGSPRQDAAQSDVRLDRSLDDLRREQLERQERVRIELRAHDPAQTERALEAWEQRAERSTRAADLHQDLDATSLPLAERDSLELERSVQRVHQTLERKRAADRALRRQGGTSRALPGFRD